MGFQVILPNKTKYHFLSRAGSTPQSKSQTVEEFLDTYKIGGKLLREYSESNWLSNITHESPPILPEDKVKSMLDRFGTYILSGQFKAANVLTPLKEKACKDFEIPASNCDHDIDHLFYSVDTEVVDSGGCGSTGRNSKFLNGYSGTVVVSQAGRRLNNKRRKYTHKPKQFKDTRCYRMIRLPEAICSEWVYAWGDDVRFQGKHWKIDNADYIQNADGMSKHSKVLCRQCDDGYYFYNEDVADISDDLKRVL